jgi:hypothetical protein
MLSSCKYKELLQIDAKNFQKAVTVDIIESTEDVPQ